MNTRERIVAALNYGSYDRLPLVHFGFWRETLELWAAQGHLAPEEARTWGDGNPTDAVLTRKLGFDANYASCFAPDTWLRPPFEPQVIRTLEDGSRHTLNGDGVIVLDAAGATGIPAEIDHLFKGRREWEEHYRGRLAYHRDRVWKARVRVHDRMVSFDNGGLDFLRGGGRDYLYGLHCGSLFGTIRNFIGVENCAYLQMDDEPLFDEIIAAVADLCYRCVEEALATGARFDFAHFWEDICYKNGPLVAPAVFHDKVGPHYRRITDLLRRHGIAIVSLDSDGCIDALIPTWIENGVNTMFPIEVGTWNASIAPWRARYGQDLRGVGGMNKVVFSRDRAAVDAEIERLRPLVDLGGYIPCPDHRLAPDSKWDNVRYYCERMRSVFG
jgi:uroporphyrinogen decarboxylase